MTKRLFVYGSLAPGRANAHLLADVPGAWTAATVRGRLVQEGWGAAMGFPALVPDDDGDSVRGFVFASEALSPQWGRLDAFEDGYDRVVVVATLDDGTRVEAYTYAAKQAEL